MKYRVTSILSDTEIEVSPHWFWANRFGSRVIDRTAVNFGRPKQHQVGDTVELILPEYILGDSIVCIPFNPTL